MYMTTITGCNTCRCSCRQNTNSWSGVDAITLEVVDTLSFFITSLAQSVSKVISCCGYSQKTHNSATAGVTSSSHQTHHQSMCGYYKTPRYYESNFEFELGFTKATVTYKNIVSVLFYALRPRGWVAIVDYSLCMNNIINHQSS